MFSLYAGVISLIADAPVATAAVLSLERGKITFSFPAALLSTYYSTSDITPCHHPFPILLLPWPTQTDLLSDLSPMACK
jgi:hypothetical protein